MDKNDFYRKASLRICGDLKIEEALFATFQFLRQTMPVDWMSLEYFEKNLLSMRTIAIATPAGGEKVDLLAPLSNEAQQMVKQRLTKEFRKARIVTDPKKYQIVQELTKFHNLDMTSLLDLTLVSEDQLLGYLVLVGEGKKLFTQRHADLLSLLQKPFAVAMSNALKHLEVIKLKDLLTDDNRFLHGELRSFSFVEIVGSNFGLKDVMHKVQQVAPINSPVLLLGETGVGKDVIANAIHYSSSRSNGPFISVNCGAIPDTLIDSELFGHEKGAFTGALSQKRGRFERANKGTIFLDEIGELPLQAQVRLLKVLQSKEIERVGGIKTIPLDIRIIAATNRNLEEMIKDHQFREDLWFRINVFPIWIPPLRDRRVDIPALLQHFINLKSKELKLPAVPTLAPGAVDPLMKYHWPGNVRELENVIERSLILNPTGPLKFDHMNLGHLKTAFELQGQDEGSDSLDEVVSRHIRQILSKTKGKVNGPDGAAALLGMNPSTLRNRMKKLGIDYGIKSKS